MNKLAPLVFCLGLLAINSACKKDYNYIFDVGSETLYQSNAEKTKQKSSSQYISILYNNLFQTSITQLTLSQLSELRLAFGDKQLVDDLIINAAVHSTGVQVPTNAAMRANITQFVEDTYIRFFLRKPSPYEARYLKEAIEADAALTPALIFSSFALSNEYKFY